MKKYLPLILWFLLSFATTAQERVLFDQGLNSYKNGNYQQARSLFMRIMKEYPNGRLSTGARLLLGKAYYKLIDYPNAEVVCKFFFKKHPESVYLDDMHHLLGNVFFRMRKYPQALEEWLWVLNKSKDPRLKKTDSKYIYRTMDHYLSERQIDLLRKKHQNQNLNGLIKLVAARKMIEQGDDRQAKHTLDTFLKDYPNHIFSEEAQRLLGASTSSATTSTLNGFLYLKQTDEETKPIAEAIQQGMDYALEEYRRRNPKDKLELRTVEVNTNAVTTLSIATEEIKRLNPLAIIGPVDPDLNAGVSIISKYEKRSHVVPLSSQTGLTGLSDYTFQINPDSKTKGQFLGQYATKELGARNLAVLAPANDYGESFVQSFIEEVQSGGGNVTTVQWYYESAQDFTRQFRAIWREGFYLAFRDSIMSEDSTLSDSQIKEAFQQYKDEKFEPRRIGARIDSTDLPSTGIDAVLIVLRSPQFIQYFSTQLAFNNIKTTLLGNEGWNDPGQLRKYKDHLEGLIYTTAGYYNPDSPNYRVFMNRFRNTMGVTPEQYHLLGYDLMKWLLSNYSPGISHGELRDKLANSQLYRGIFENIQFSTTPRVNSELTVLKLNLGRIIPLNY